MTTMHDGSATASWPCRQALVLADLRVPRIALCTDDVASRAFALRGVAGEVETMRLRASATGGDP